LIRDQWERQAEGVCPQRSCRSTRSGPVRQGKCIEIFK
jgi:hypothetical protein